MACAREKAETSLWLFVTYPSRLLGLVSKTPSALVILFYSCIILNIGHIH
jgi:hypothetical protein